MCKADIKLLIINKHFVPVFVRLLKNRILSFLNISKMFGFEIENHEKVLVKKDVNVFHHFSAFAVCYKIGC